MPFSCRGIKESPGESGYNLLTTMPDINTLHLSLRRRLTYEPLNSNYVFYDGTYSETVKGLVDRYNATHEDLLDYPWIVFGRLMLYSTVHGAIDGFVCGFTTPGPEPDILNVQERSTEQETAHMVNEYVRRAALITNYTRRQQSSQRGGIRILANYFT